MGLSHSPKIVSDNLVLMLDFANPKTISGNTLTNILGNELTITLSNPNANSLVVANGYAEFNPIDLSNAATYYTIQNNSYFANNARQEVTMEVAFYTYRSMSTEGDRYRTRPVSPRVTESGQPVGFGHGNTNFQVEVNANGAWKSTYVSPVADAAYNTWIILTQTTSSNANSTLTYVNGTIYSNLSLGAFNASLSNGNGYLIGRGYYGGVVNYNGRVAYLKVYNRVLSAAEVRQNFNAIRGRFGI